MTDDELITKAIEWLRKFDSHLPEQIHDVTVDRLPKRRLRDAVVIDFTSEEDRGTIQVVLERETGALIGATHTPPKSRQKDSN
jgi:hypothetical protein